MFLLFNLVGQTIVNLGLADEFVAVIKVLDVILSQFISIR